MSLFELLVIPVFAQSCVIPKTHSYNEYKHMMNHLSDEDNHFMKNDFRQSIDAWNTGIFGKNESNKHHYENLHKGLEIMKKWGLIKAPKNKTLYRGIGSDKDHKVNGKVSSTGKGNPIHSWTSNLNIARGYAEGQAAKGKKGYVLKKRSVPSNYLGHFADLEAAHDHALKYTNTNKWDMDWAHMPSTKHNDEHFLDAKTPSKIRARVYEKV